MKLKDPTDADLKRQFGIYIAGWSEFPGDVKKCYDPSGFSCYWSEMPDWLESAGAVIYLLNNENWASRYRTLTTHEVTITRGAKRFVGVDAEWAKAAVIALLRANGVTIEFTK